VTLLAVSLLAAGGIGIAIGTLPTRDAVPADPTASPTFWASDTLLPDTFGDVSGLHLALDAAQPTDEVEIAPDPGLALLCRDRRLTIPALRTVVAGRNLQLRAPTSFERQAVLVFASEDDARLFMTQVRTAALACRDDGPTETADPPLSYRSTPTFAEADVPGDEAFAWGAYTEISSDQGATWNNATDAGIDVLARSGTEVSLAGLGGEYAGDLTRDPEAMGLLSGWLGVSLGD